MDQKLKSHCLFSMYKEIQVSELFFCSKSHLATSPRTVGGGTHMVLRTNPTPCCELKIIHAVSQIIHESKDIDLK